MQDSVKLRKMLILLLYALIHVSKFHVRILKHFLLPFLNIYNLECMKFGPVQTGQC